MQHSYRQLVKQIVREHLLSEAITLLTERRQQAPIVQLDELKQTLAHAQILLNPFHLPHNFVEEIEREFQGWANHYNAQVGTRTKQELKALYLCGPEPTNDLKVLLSAGIDIHNVWAVETRQQDLSQALEDLRWLPPIWLVPERFESLGFQVLARCILDRIGRSDWSSETHPFRGSAVAGLGDMAYPADSLCPPLVQGGVRCTLCDPIRPVTVPSM